MATVVFANQGSNDISIMTGNGNRSLNPAIHYAGAEQTRSVAAADFNKDGKTDVAATVIPASGFPGVVIFLSTESGVTSASKSTVTATPASVTADGTSTATVTVTLLDAHENRISGHAVSLAQGNGSSTITPATATTDANGIATFTVTNRKMEKVTYTATDEDDHTTITQTTEVSFTPPYTPPPYYPVTC